MMDYPNIEFLREGYGMIADPGEKDPGSPACFPRTSGGKIMTGLLSTKGEVRV